MELGRWRMPRRFNATGRMGDPLCTVTRGGRGRVSAVPGVVDVRMASGVGMATPGWSQARKQARGVET